MMIREIREAIRKLTPMQRQDVAEWLTNSGEFDARVAESAVVYGQPHDMGYMTVEEYLEFEENSPMRHEYAAGLIFAMPAVKLRHAVVVSTLMYRMQNHLREGPCDAIASQMKVHIRVEENEFYYYPDVVVTCGPQEMDSVVVDTPRLIIEVLSPSSERTDRSEKRLNYRHIASLEEYVLVAQLPYEVTIHRRSENWSPLVLTTPESIVEFRSIGLGISLEQIYQRVRRS
jgi:Uma2 family endonuclease